MFSIFYYDGIHFLLVSVNEFYAQLRILHIVFFQQNLLRYCIKNNIFLMFCSLNESKWIHFRSNCLISRLNFFRSYFRDKLSTLDDDNDYCIAALDLSIHHLLDTEVKISTRLGVGWCSNLYLQGIRLLSH